MTDGCARLEHDVRVARAAIGSQTRQAFIHQIFELGKLPVNTGNSPEKAFPQVDLVTQLTFRVQEQEKLYASLHVHKRASTTARPSESRSKRSCTPPSTCIKERQQRRAALRIRAALNRTRTLPRSLRYWLLRCLALELLAT
jgi:hypothetical protein